jgi:hypothetical protein
MVCRCNRKAAHNYARYGGVGVTVCERWLVFENFLADMGEKPTNTSIDRIDGSLGYFMENCRWATITEQQRNIKSNINATFNGVTKCVSAWAEELGTSPGVISYRIQAGWGDKTFTTPVKYGNRVNSR